MDADLVLDGGGVKGIALAGAFAGMSEAGYRFHRIAGTSAGAVVGALIAAGATPELLTSLMRQVNYRSFEDEGLLDRFGPIGKSLSLLFEKGIYEGKYFRDWLDGLLRDLGVHTFGDLREEDAESALPPEHAYRLVVIASDVSRGRLVRLPWDYPIYGLDPDEQPIADAVRASMSIPFFFEPVRLRTPGDDGREIESFIIDGGILSSFPVEVFDRTDRRSPRWPTFGVKLSARPESALMQRFEIETTLDFAKAVLGTVLTWHDQMHVDDPCVADRTVFVDTSGVRATDFDLDPATEQRLYERGHRAAGKFLETWDFPGHIARCRT